MEATFCFVDLTGFTALTEAHGDHAAADLAARFGAAVDASLEGDVRIPAKSDGHSGRSRTPIPVDADQRSFA